MGSAMDLSNHLAWAGRLSKADLAGRGATPSDEAASPRYGTGTTAGGQKGGTDEIEELIAVVAFAVGGAIALLLAAFAGTGASQSPAAAVGSGKASATKSVCGLGNGKKATGRPIKLGGIDMLIPGVDFTTIGKVAKAYFKCVNDNGGIHGRPIKYILYTEQLNPAQEAALARKLIESDKVVGVVGNTSFAECGDELEVLPEQGLRRDRRGRPGRVLRHAVASWSRTWGPRYSEHRRGAGADPRGARSRDRVA